MFTIIPDLKSSEADSITVSNYNKMKPVVMTKEAQGKVESYSGLRVREVLSSMWIVKLSRGSRDGYFIVQMVSEAEGTICEGCKEGAL